MSWSAFVFLLSSRLLHDAVHIFSLAVAVGNPVLTETSREVSFQVSYRFASSRAPQVVPEGNMAAVFGIVTGA